MAGPVNSVERRAYSGARLQPANFGAGGEIIAQAAEGFGRDMRRTLDNLSEIEKRDAETAAQEADNIRLARRLKRFYGDPESGERGFFNQEGKNALLDYEKLEKDLQQIDAEAGSMLAKKPFAKKMFDDMSMKRASDDMPRIAQFVNKERAKHEEAVDADAFDLAIDNASSATDPMVIEENIATAGNIAVRRLLRSGNYDENAIRQARQSGVGKAVAAVAEQMNLTSPSEAQAFVVLKAKEMDPQDAAKLLETLAPSAAKEQADEQVGAFLVTTNDRLQANPTAEANPVVPGARSATPIPNEAALDAAQWAQESGGVHRTASGELLTSSAGARGVSQVMPGTGVSPGYGVKPLQNNSREEYIRFGKDYRNAMLKEYDGNIVLALTAYNWGPKRVNEHIQKVGDPRKGQISDAGFLNSIPVKEARDYAELVLGKAGVQVGGGAQVDPSVAQAPTYQGQEINLAATFAKIDASDLTYTQKQALKDSASRQHSLGRQAKAEAEERLKEATWTEVNKLGDGFTSYDQLPIALRQQLATNPQLEGQFRNQAQTNENARLQKIEAERNEREEAVARETELDMLDLAYTDPAAFMRLDLRTLPGLTHSQRTSLMSRQNTIRESKANPGEEGRVDFDRVRAALNRFAPTNIDPKSKEGRGKMGQAFDQAIVMAQNLVKQNGGKALSDAQVEGIARQLMMPVTIRTSGFLGTGQKTVPRFEAPEAIKRAGKNYAGNSGRLFDLFKADIMVKENRVPSDEEVRQKIRMYTQSGGR
jgi:soluble lytic murein transglycosylase-like protein